MKYFILLLLSLIAIACVNSNNYGETNKTLQNSHIHSVETSQKYRYFDLFTMRGKEACDGDSCVKVVQKHDTIILETKYPQRYRLVLLHKDNYWYSCAEFDMDKDRSAMPKSEPWPRRYDMFIFNNVIYQYAQIYSSEMIFKTLYIKKPYVYKAYHLGADNNLDSPKTILNIIHDFIDKKDIKSESGNIYDVIRDRTSVQIISHDPDYRIVHTYPEMQIWGLPFGL